MEILEQANWVDLLSLILIIRISYVGSLVGIGRQLLPLLFLLATLTISIYYYGNIGLYLSARTNVSQSVGNFLGFVFISGALQIIYKIASNIAMTKRPDVLIPIERIGGGAIGFLRGLFVAGILLLALLLTPIAGFGESVIKSLSGKHILRLDAEVYAAIMTPLIKAHAIKTRTKKTKQSSQQILVKDVLTQLTKDKDYELSFFKTDMKSKSRFFREEKYQNK